MRSFALFRASNKVYPGVYQDMLKFIDDESAAKLVTQYGGCAGLYIPVKLAPEHSLCLLLGEEMAKRLSAEFGGLTVEIPRACALKIAERNKLILKDKEAGLTQSRLARKYQLTVRSIRKITTNIIDKIG